MRWFFRCHRPKSFQGTALRTPVGAALRALLRLFTSSLGSRNVHLTKVLIPLIALLIDHQNHSKWHTWCHVRYNLPLFCDWWQHNQNKYKFAKIDKFNHLIPIEINWKPLTLAWMFTIIQWWLGLPLKPWFPPLFLPYLSISPSWLDSLRYFSPFGICFFSLRKYHVLIHISPPLESNHLKGLVPKNKVLQNNIAQEKISSLGS